jgi:hypothetical protein
MEKWAFKHTSCQECHRTDRKHSAHGLCSCCYQRRYFSEHHKKLTTTRQLWRYLVKRRVPGHLQQEYKTFVDTVMQGLRIKCELCHKWTTAPVIRVNHAGVVLPKPIVLLCRKCHLRTIGVRPLQTKHACRNGHAFTENPRNYRMVQRRYARPMRLCLLCERVRRDRANIKRKKPT